MFAFRTTIRVLCAAAFLAAVATVQAAEKPKSLGPKGNTPKSARYEAMYSVEFLKAKPGTTKPFNGVNSTGTGTLYQKAEPGKNGKRHGK